MLAQHGALWVGVTDVQVRMVDQMHRPLADGIQPQRQLDTGTGIGTVQGQPDRDILGLGHGRHQQPRRTGRTGQ